VTTSAGDPVLAQRRPRGRVWLYAVAFAMLLVSGWLQAMGNLHSRLTLVWSSIAVSIAAALVAVASVLVPGRRVHSTPLEASEATAPQSATSTMTGNGAGAGAASATATGGATLDVNEDGADEPEPDIQDEAPGADDEAPEAPAEGPEARDEGPEARNGELDADDAPNADEDAHADEDAPGTSGEEAEADGGERPAAT
jgi:hypothetical protein